MDGVLNTKMKTDESPPYTKRELYLSGEMMKQARFNNRDDSLKYWVRALIRDARKETSKEYELKIAKIIKHCENGNCERLKEAREGYVRKEEIRKWKKKWNKDGVVDTDMEIKLTKLLEEK